MKRSEFYSLVIICILLCSLNTAFAVSYQTSVIQPTKPFQVPVIRATAENNTYYTVCDITGKGILSQVKINGPAVSGDNRYYKFKVTVDGGTPTEVGAYASQMPSAGFASIQNDAIQNDHEALGWLGAIYFKTSLKIEFKQTSGDVLNVNCTANYATE